MVEQPGLIQDRIVRARNHRQRQGHGTSTLRMRDIGIKRLDTEICRMIAPVLNG